MPDTPPSTPRWLGWAVVGLAVLMVFQAALARYREHERAEERGELITCLAAWAVDLGTALEARSKLNAADKPTNTVPLPDALTYCEGITR